MISNTLTIDDILQKTTDLPTIPTAALAVMREADSSTGSAQSVAKALSQDQSLTVRVLRLANSAYYGLNRKVIEPQEAVVVLGLRCVKNLVMVASTYPWMTRSLKGYEMDPSALWSHSFATAIGSQMVAKRCGKAPDDVAFTAGLLHNIGKVALSVWLENKLAGLTSIAERGGLPFDEIERKFLGYDHAEVGAALGERWNLPEPLVLAIRNHHRPSEQNPTSPLTDAVHLGDHLAMNLGIGLSGEGLRYEFDQDAAERLDLNQQDLDEMLIDFLATYQQHERLFQEYERAF